MIQVTGSSGLPYTLYIDLAAPHTPSTIVPDDTTVNDSMVDRTASPTPARSVRSDVPMSDISFPPSTPLTTTAPSPTGSPTSSGSPSAASVTTTTTATATTTITHSTPLRSRSRAVADAAAFERRRIARAEEACARARRVEDLARDLARLYCPCVGFMFNSLAGEKNYFVSADTGCACCVCVNGDNEPTRQCKHLLAAVLAHYAGKLVRTEVYFAGVVDLLGLAPPTPAVL